MHFYYIIFSCIEARQVFHPSSFTIFPDCCHCTYWTSCYDICVDTIIIVRKTTGWTKDNFSWIKISIIFSCEINLRYQVYVISDTFFWPLLCLSATWSAFATSKPFRLVSTRITCLNCLTCQKCLKEILKICCWNLCFCILFIPSYLILKT